MSESWALTTSVHSVHSKFVKFYSPPRIGFWKLGTVQNVKNKSLFWAVPRLWAPLQNHAFEVVFSSDYYILDYSATI